MKIFLYLIIAVALAARGALFLVQWKLHKHRRNDDRYMAVSFIFLSFSFGLYAFEGTWPPSGTSQILIDSILAVFVVYTVVRSLIAEIKLGRKEG